MPSDILTIIWKEWKEIVIQRPSFRGGWIGMLVFMVVFGVMLPLQTGPEWVNKSTNLFIWAWVPFLLVSGVVADAIAGERERHTLETLLASRISDQAILYGKIGAAMSYGWGITMLSVLVSLLTVNLAYGSQGWLFYPLDIASGIVSLSLLVSWLAAGLGVLVSLRAPTVRHAQQTFSMAFFVLFIPLFVFPLLPEAWQLRLAQWASAVNFRGVVLAIALFLLILDILLMALARARFKRTRLLLD